MTRRLAVEPAPGPLEDYAESFDDLSLELGLSVRGFAATWKGFCFRQNATRRSPHLRTLSP